jgi:hypothetical protein
MYWNTDVSVQYITGCCCNYRWLFIGARNSSTLECGVISKPIVLEVLYFFAFVTVFLWNLSVQELSIRLRLHTLN